MLALLTTARKALVAALAGFLAPLYVLVQTGEEVTGRSLMACGLAGALAGLSTYQAPNTDAYEPQRKHAADNQVDPQ